MKKKYWSKFRPNCTATVIGEPDHRGLSPAYVEDAEMDPEGSFSTAINLSEWSDTEVVPVPLSVPDMGFVLIYGQDPDEPEYEFHAKETDAAVAMAQYGPQAFGYAPVSISRFAMVPPKSRK